MAATLVEPGRIEPREYPYPERLEPGAVLVRMLASGICGTDKHTFRETEQYADRPRGRRRFPSSRDTRTSASSGSGPAGPRLGRRRARGRRPRRPRRTGPAARAASARATFRTTSASARELRQSAHRRRAAAPLRRLGRALPAAGHADLPGARRAPTDVAVLTELMSVTHSLDLAVWLPRPGGLRSGTRSRSSASAPLGLVHVARPHCRAPGASWRSTRSRRAFRLARELGADEAVAPEEVGRLDADVVVDASGHPDSSCPRSSFSGTAGRSSRSAPSSRSARGRSTPRCCAAAT